MSAAGVAAAPCILLLRSLIVALLDVIRIVTRYSGRPRGLCMSRPQNNRDQSADRPVVQWLSVEADQAGQRLDNFLLAHLKGVPKSLIYRIIRKGEVRVNKARARPDSRIQSGDLIRVPPVKQPETPPPALPGERLQALVRASVVFANKDLYLVNKPSGLAVHGGSGVDFGLIEVMRAAFPDAPFLELVHRIDRDTSGLVMIARRRPALRHLQEQIRARRVVKRYHALVAGLWPASVDKVEVPLSRDALVSGERIVRADESGKASRTFFRLLECFSGYSLVEAQPVTGRTHQIRVHCQFAGHPIAGDEKYMDDASRRAFRKLGGRRLMLHAGELEFCLPGESRPQRFVAEWADDFREMIERLRRRKAL